MSTKVEMDKLFYVQDELFSPTRLIDPNGEPKETFSYDEFGAPNDPLRHIINYKDFGNVFGFTGYQFEEVSEFWFAQARYYDSFKGRFVSEDSIHGFIQNPLTQNRNIYCISNPLMFVDFDGKIVQLAPIIFGGIAGGVTSALIEIAIQASNMNEFSLSKFDVGKIINATVTGMVSGMFSGSNLGVWFQVGINAGMGFVNSLANDEKYSPNKDFSESLKDALISGLIGGLAGFIGGPGAQYIGGKHTAEYLKALADGGIIGKLLREHVTFPAALKAIFSSINKSAIISFLNDIIRNPLEVSKGDSNQYA